ncbi:CapA family protein [Candidatus Peregrinibacteria bacterium]|jgi:hypothetical protein|nr:CapA family protein [Candidatus Peregrinibacteria bacterium]MBT4147861.1 CapA family protein [Candidatus Peregrinibacteria bacterium]MBT4456311.1 CapA family protein [Candidatus Peregrinibacteria bacterium]
MNIDETHKCGKGEICIDFVGDVILAGDYRTGSGKKDPFNSYFKKVSDKFNLGDGQVSKILFSDFRELFGQSFTIANFEGVAEFDGARDCMTDKVPYKSSGEPVRFLVEKVGLESFFTKNSNINAASLSNNHAFDFGSDGLAGTVSILNKNGVETFGAGDSREETCLPKIVKYKDRDIALIGISSVVDVEDAPAENVLAESDGVVISAFSDVDELKSKLEKAILTAKQAEADIICVYFHWGREWSSHPGKAEVELGRFAAETGAHLVVGTHQHSAQGIEEYKLDDGRIVPIVYGLGNFVFGVSKYPKSPVSYVFRARFSKKTGEFLRFDLIPFTLGGQAFLDKSSITKTFEELSEKKSIYKPCICSPEEGKVFFDDLIKKSDFGHGVPEALFEARALFDTYSDFDKKSVFLEDVRRDMVLGNLIDEKLIMKTRIDTPDVHLYIVGNEKGLYERLNVLSDLSGVFVGVGNPWRLLSQAFSLKSCKGICMTDHNPFQTEVLFPLFVGALRHVPFVSNPKQYYFLISEYVSLFVEDLCADIFDKYHLLGKKASSSKYFKNLFQPAFVKNEVLKSLIDMDLVFGDKFVLSSQDSVDMVLALFEKGKIKTATLDFTDPSFDNKLGEILVELGSKKIATIDISNSVEEARAHRKELVANLKRLKNLKNSKILYSAGGKVSYSDLSKNLPQKFHYFV